ncbi:MAG: peptide chain release factor N(5)-glutamine methyltransferase [Candidatus Kaelpia aquatica]|nr:peptide chain release factor N(5)-glutamine methyltransferase [Candidatus Kaelpia aquatica]
MRAVDIVSRYSSEISKREVEEIMLSILNLKCRSELYMAEVENFPLSEMDYFLSQRKRGIPLQYLTSNVNFYGFDFNVEEGVFIPRPETEVIVDYIAKEYFGYKNLKILEIGTGTGVIAICLTKLFSDCKIVATDISPTAIRVASENAVLNGSISNVLFVKGDSVGFIKKEGFFDLLVSNPPYIAFSQEGVLSPEVKKEPREALFGGENGYEFTLKLIVEASAVIKKGGRMVIEIDPEHRFIYERELGGAEKLEFIEDLEHKERVMVIGF